MRKVVPQRQMRRLQLPSLVLTGILLLQATVCAQVSIDYSGEVEWDEKTATLTFRTSGTMPDTKEGFFYRVPAQVERIVIDSGVQVKGGFRVLYRDARNPLHIVGKDRESSVIFGSEEEAWTDRNSVPENEKWKYSSISVVEDAVVHVANLTCKNPRGYIISGYADNAVIHVDACSLLDTRTGDNNNSDGFAGASGSSVKNSLISTSDDGIKIYHDIVIENTTIEHHRNGAPLQFGWGGESGAANAQIKCLGIKGVDRDNRYNMAPLTWERGEGSVRNVSIDGLEVAVMGEVYDEEEMTWRPIGLFELKPFNCEFNLTAVNAKLNGLPLGVRNTRGVVDISKVLE